MLVPDVSSSPQDLVLERLRAGRARLERLGVRRLFLFGSMARGTAGDESDVDLMVELDEGELGRKPLLSAFDVGAIQAELVEIVGRPVDLLVRRDALRRGGRLAATAQDALLDVF